MWTGHGYNETAPAQKLPRETGRAQQKWCVLVALCLQEGDTLLQLQGNKVWGGGSDGETGMSVQGG